MKVKLFHASCGLLGCMHKRLDVKQAVTEANAMVRRHALWVCGPMLLLGFTVSGVSALLREIPARGVAGVLTCLSLLTCVLAYVPVETLVSVIWVRLRAHEEPRIGFAREVLGFAALPRTALAIALRYFGWLFVACLGGLIAAFPVLLASTVGHALTHHAPSQSGSAHQYSWFGSLWIICMLVLWMLLIARYSLSVPLLALTQGRVEKVISRGIEMSRGIWSTLAFFAVVGVSPVLLYSLLNSFVLRPAHAPLRTIMLFRLFDTFVVNCLASWLVLVRTGIASQLMEPMQPSDETGASSRTGGSN